MRPTILATVLALSALGAAPDPVQATELQQPSLLSTGDVPTAPPPGAISPPGSSSGCTALSAPPGTVHPARLVIRNSPRSDVGPYTVTLPGYADGQTSSGRDSYRPALMQASAGDTLRFDLVDQLPSSFEHEGVVNLHTHGILSSPRPCVPLGDYIFVEDQPGTTTSYRVDVPAALPGYQFGGQLTPQVYPSGLNWFHSHVHTRTRDDLMAGQSGFLYIGDLERDLLASPNLAPAAADALRNSDVLYLGLRDIQLAVPFGALPDKVKPGQTAQWIHGSDYNPNACLAYANPAIPLPGAFAGPGYCGHYLASVDGKLNWFMDTVWLYTVNGQQNPSITMKPGRNQIWRVANLSPDVTYVLELDDDATGKPQMIDALALDGLAAGTSASGDTALHVGVDLTHVLLMPASRAELLVLNNGGSQGRHLTLRTTGITTGISGSHWPRIDLAQVAMPAAVPQAAGAVAMTDVSTMKMTLPKMMPVAAAVATTPVDSAIPANCVTLPAGRVTRRRITFTTDLTGKTFELGSEVVDVNGIPIDAAHTIKPEAFPMEAMTAPNSLPHICAQLGTQEVWEIVNYTGELHNFHLHQNKFRLTQQSDPGAPPNLVSFQDPANLIAQYEPEARNNVSTESVDVWHDVFPLPPYGGRIFITVPFMARQQVGTFVYHCHILSHEDAGMMATIQVFDPAQTARLDGGTRLAGLSSFSSR